MLEKWIYGMVGVLIGTLLIWPLSALANNYQHSSMMRDMNGMMKMMGGEMMGQEGMGGISAEEHASHHPDNPNAQENI